MILFAIARGPGNGLDHKMKKHTHMTREWVEWLDQNIDRGCRPEDTIAAMVDSGFDAEFAAQVLRERPRERLNPGTTQSGISTKYRYDTPLIQHRGNVIVTSDRTVRVVMRLERPLVVLLEDVFSPEECDAVIELASAGLERSAVVDPDSGADLVHEARSSEGAFLTQKHPLLERLDKRISELCNHRVEHGESLHALRYKVGAQYKPHHDFFDPNSKGSKNILKRGGQRLATLIVYLNDVDEGGDTIFPHAGLSVVPKRGSAVYFEYMNDDGQLDDASLHGGAPVIEGEKWIVTKWVREDSFA